MQKLLLSMARLYHRLLGLIRPTMSRALLCSCSMRTRGILECRTSTTVQKIKTNMCSAVNKHGNTFSISSHTHLNSCSTHEKHVIDILAFRNCFKYSKIQRSLQASAPPHRARRLVSPAASSEAISITLWRQ